MAEILLNCTESSNNVSVEYMGYFSIRYGAIKSYIFLLFHTILLILNYYMETLGFQNVIW